MPNFGFNPFVPRANVYTTGVDAGDSRRYYSRDVIRMGHERVEIDATLTPGEPGRGYQTQFEKEIAAMVKKERQFPMQRMASSISLTERRFDCLLPHSLA